MELKAFLDSVQRRDWQTTTEGTVRIAVIGLGWWSTE
jgi:xylose dehydrogenase (NAD/NADP)